jgi:hypothetical protein
MQHIFGENTRVTHMHRHIDNCRLTQSAIGVRKNAHSDNYFPLQQLTRTFPQLVYKLVTKDRTKQ